MAATPENCRCVSGGSCACRIAAQAPSPLPSVDPTAWDVRRRRAVRRAAGGRVADRSSLRRVSVLLLDVGGVVIPSLFESVSIEGFPTGPLTSEPAWAKVQRGETSERDYWATVSTERPNLDVRALWQACSSVRDELRRSLDALAGRVRLVAFTNDMGHFFGERWPERFPEMRAFDAVVEASKLGVHKPDPEAFFAAAAAVGEKPDRCLFVDDLDANLCGARKSGMHARLFDVRDPATSVARVLDDLGLAAETPEGTERAFRRIDPDGTVPRGFGVAAPATRGAGTTFSVPAADRSPFAAARRWT